MTKTTLFTSESVSEGHPDKVADQISDAILDAFLAVDPYARVACETQITNNHLVLAGEITAAARPAQPLVEIARDVIRRIGYTSDALGFDCDNAVYTDLTHTQSREIGASVAHGGAGDQGLMFGYACDETPEGMPLSITVAHKLVQRQSELRNNGSLPWLRPDAKSQVTVQYENDVPVGITTVVLSTQHDPAVTQQEISEKVRELIILPVVRAYFPDADPVCLVNPSGSFTIGGPYGDTGLTGRKIIVDSYGGSCPHGGGAFSGKDPSKVDRSGAYAARWVAKHIVAAGLAKRCTVQVAYAIGVEEPVSLYIDFHGTARVVEHQAEARIRELFDLRPRTIIEKLRLHDTRYEPTAAYGHFGREIFPWEQLDEKILAGLKGLNPKIDHESDKISIREKLSAATDEELIALHNQNSKLKGHSQRVLTWVYGLHDEIRRRNIDSEVITDRDDRGRVCGYHSQLPVAIREVNGKKILVPDAALK